MSPRIDPVDEPNLEAAADETPIHVEYSANQMLQLLQAKLSSVERGFTKLGRHLEEAIDNSPIGVKLPGQQQGVKADDSPAREPACPLTRTPAVFASTGDKGADLAGFYGGLVHTAKRSLKDNNLAMYRAEPAPSSSSQLASTQGIAAAARKSAVAVGGGTLIGVGVVMIPTLPPPFATLTMLSGYAVLGTEFEGPRNVVKGAREKLNMALDGESENKEGEDDKADFQAYVDSGGDSANTGKKDNRFKKVVKSFGKTVVLPALDHVCTAYEKFEEKEKELQDNKDASDESSEEETMTPAADEVLVEDEEEETTPTRNEFFVGIEEDIVPAEDDVIVGNEEQQAEDNFFDANEEHQADEIVKSESWSDVEDEGKEEPSGKDSSGDDDNWDDAIVVSHFDD